MYMYGQSHTACSMCMHCRTSSDSEVASHQQGLVSNRPALDDVLEQPGTQRTVLAEPHEPFSPNRPAGKPPPEGTKPDFIALAFHDSFRAGPVSVADGYVSQTQRSYQGDRSTPGVGHSEITGGTAIPRLSPSREIRSSLPSSGRSSR